MFVRVHNKTVPMGQGTRPASGRPGALTGRIGTTLALAAWILLGFGRAGAQTAAVEGADVVTERSSSGLEDSGLEEHWAFSVSAFAYFVPDERNYVQPTVTADRGSLHLEARYNYEAMETGSLWLGVNFAGEGQVWWEFTPMMGGVLGETTGIAPGLRGSLGWWWLELSLEGEYVMDMDDAEGDFLYLWSELTISPAEWFRCGVAGQRTRAYETDLDTQRGFVVGFTYRSFDLSAYVFNPDEDQPTVVVAVAFEF